MRILSILLLLPFIIGWTFAGGWDNDASGGGEGITFYTVATLPGTPSANDLAGVSDGDDAGDCTTGGGSEQNICVYSGSAWVVVGDGTGAAGTGDVFSVGDCLSGACLDGTSDGGTYARIYDGDSHYLEINPANLSANRSVAFRDASGTVVLSGDALTGEIAATLEADGSTAVTISNNVVDEANMKISNGPTNDQVLTADSGATGGWKWADAAGGDETNSLEAITTGIAANEVPMGTSANTVVYKVLPDCNITGSALNYENSTQEWSCRSGYASGAGMSGFVMEDGDGTEVSMEDSSEFKFVDSTGLDINFTDTTPGSDADPFDLTFTLDSTLADISDGTIVENLVNTSNPWADNEVSDTLTASTSTLASANDNDTSIATTSFVQQEINGAGGTGLTCSSGSCSVDLGTSIATTELTSPTGSDTNVVTGTKGSTDDCAKWDANGDLVSAGAACGSGGGATTDGGAVTYVTGATDDFAVGGTTSAAPFFYDEGEETLTLTTTDESASIAAISGALLFSSTVTIDSGDSAGSAISFVGTTADDCATWGEGALFYNNTDKAFCFCNGTSAVLTYDTTVSCY